MNFNSFLQPSIWCLLLLGCLATSCRKDLCYHHEEHGYGIKLQAKFTWELEWERPYKHQWEENWLQEWDDEYDSFCPVPSKGVRSIAYHDEGGVNEGNLSPVADRVPVQAGTSSLLFYNNDTEYIVFTELNTVASAKATTRTVNRNGFMALHRNERTMNEPDMLFGHYEKKVEAQPSVEPVVLPVLMKPLVYTYYIRYEFSSGLEYVGLARGALAGMAESVYLVDGHTGDMASTILYDGWLEDYGVEASVQTFGVPNYPGDHYTRADGSPAQFTLNLEVRLKNGLFKIFNFDVTDQILKQPRGGVIVVEDIVIPREEGEQGGGGFDVEIEGWGDQIDIPLPL